MGRYACALLLLVGVHASLHAETVIIEADRDATLIEDAEGDLANGAGPAFFVGRTSQGGPALRRALLRFDVAAALPRRAIIEKVELTLHMTPSNAASAAIRLHRVQSDWGEGPSASFGGSGALSQPGDTTWLHTFYDDQRWLRPGGTFLPRASTSVEVAGAGSHTWPSTRLLVRDVRQWNAAPQRNFGWILIGDEQNSQSVKRFASREEADVSLVPVLEVTYRLPGRRPRSVKGSRSPRSR